MKHLNKDKINQLLEIIEKKPAQRVVHFADEKNPLINELLTLATLHKMEYHLNTTTEIFYSTLIKKSEKEKALTVTKFTLKRPRYMIKAIEYDYLFATLNWEENDKKSFLEKCYPIIKTGGNIIIFMKKGNYAQKDEWRDILEEQYYVSTNIIDDLFENHDVIVSKRMHGWGNK